MYFKRAISIAAGANVNIFADELVARLPRNMYGHFGITTAATGITFDLTLGDEQVAIGEEPEIVATAPAFPGNFSFLNHPVRAGRLNRCMVRNTTAGAIVIQAEFKTSMDKLATS